MSRRQRAMAMRFSVLIRSLPQMDWMLRAYQIDMEQERPTMAIANVTLRYVGNASQQVVRYILVRERGNWRIADIGNEGES